MAKSGIVAGGELDEAALEALREGSDLRAAKDRALRFLGQRAHAGGELTAKLLRYYDEPTCAAVLAWLDENDLLDDAAFAREKAEFLAGRGKSRREIAMRLAAAGIPRGDAEAALAALPQADAAAARAVVQKHYAGQLMAGQKEKVLAALARRGFSRADSLAALRAAVGEDDA